MLHMEDPVIRENLFKCKIGLEKEALRVTGDGHFTHTEDPFTDEPHIGTDFCKNQTEVNTPVCTSPEEAIASLEKYHAIIEKTLAKMEPREYLWPFSNPPYIINEDDIPRALFGGTGAGKSEDYSTYIAHKYGKYKMAFSGIHFNYSFADELLRREFELEGGDDFQEFKNQFYVVLAERCFSYSWIITAVTAASPVLDSSFFEKKRFNRTVFTGQASVRAGELGYWNYFAPLLDYSNVRNYADSIQRYVDMGLLKKPGELYCPIRLKPRGVNNLQTLREEGVDHIELRMIDLNPLVPAGMDVRDVFFCQLLLLYLGGTPRQPYTVKDQVVSVQNFKNAAHYDLKTVHINMPDGSFYTVVDEALNVIGLMEEFFKGCPQEVFDCLNFEKEKFLNQENRYAWKVRQEYGEDFVQKGLRLAKSYQELYL